MKPKFYITTAIDYPNSRPHIGTAFEKIGADVQARYRRMEGYDVHFLMGNDENTVKVSRRAAELGRDTQAYCDDMARQFKDVWRALDISFDDFIQTSEPRHHAGCRQFIQKVFDNGYIYKGHYEGWYCDGCEGFKTKTEVDEAGEAVSDPQDQSGPSPGAVLLLCPLEIPRSIARFLCQESAFHSTGVAPQRSRDAGANGVEGCQHHLAPRKSGASRCRSIWSSRSMCGSMRC